MFNFSTIEQIEHFVSFWRIVGHKIHGIGDNQPRKQKHFSFVVQLENEEREREKERERERERE